MEISRSFPGVGSALDVAHWSTRKYKKYRAFLLWMRKLERSAYEDPIEVEDEDDDTPRWGRVGDENEPDWEAERFTRVE